MPDSHEKPFVTVSLPTAEGMVHARHYVVVGSGYAVVFVGNTSKRYDSPAQKVYQRLAESLKQDGVTALQVALCNVEDPAEAVHDVRTGIQYACSLGSKTVILIGYDRGGKAALAASAQESCIAGVALLSTPLDLTNSTPPRSLLVIQGAADSLDREGAESALAALDTPKQLHILKDAGHSLDEASDEVYRLLFDWIQTLRQDRDSQAA